MTDQAPHSNHGKQPAHRPAPSENNGTTEDGTPGTLKLVDGPERVNSGDEKNSDEELYHCMSLILYP